MEKENLIDSLKNFKKIMEELNKNNKIYPLLNFQIDTTKKCECLFLFSPMICPFFNISENAINVNDVEDLKNYSIANKKDSDITIKNSHIGTILCAILNSKENIDNIIKKYRKYINNSKLMKEEAQFIIFLYNLINELIQCQSFLVLLLPTIVKSYNRIVNWENYSRDYLLEIPLDYPNTIRSVLHSLLGEIQLQLDYIYMFLNTDFPLTIDGHESMFYNGFFISNVSINCQKISDEKEHKEFHNTFNFIYTYKINSLTDIMYAYIQHYFITKFNLRKCSNPYCNKYFVCSYRQQRYCSNKCRNANQRLMYADDTAQDYAQMTIYPQSLKLECNRIEQRFRDLIKKSKNQAQIKMLRKNLEKLQLSKKEITSNRKLAYKNNNIDRLKELEIIFANYLCTISDNIKVNNYKVKPIIIPNNSLK